MHAKSRLSWAGGLLLAACIISAVVLTANADSAGPAQVAKADPHLWTEPINSAAGFDKASRASILVYVLAMQDMQKLTDAEMLETFKIKGINRPSVEKWLKKERDYALLNYQRAAKNCTTADWTCGNVASTQDLLNQANAATTAMPKSLDPWREKLNAFTHTYLAEQLRLAALFPKVSSEIDRFNDQEWLGDTLPDRQFYLSFDDGPTPAAGNSDDTLAMLDAHKKSAVFFVLGEMFNNRKNRSDAASLNALYKNQCVASHGWEHQSHAKWADWQDSVKNTQALLNNTLNKSNVLPLFRPPYGQRKADSGEFFQAQGLHVALWNLDSQDWNNKVNPDDILKRMITLMLIKRHGVLLFHDIHPKAKVALPQLFGEVGNAVEWGDCHQLQRL